MTVTVTSTPPPVPSPSPSPATGFSTACQIGYSNPDVSATDFVSAETYQEAAASGFTDGTVEVTVRNTGSAGEVLDGFTVTFSLDGTIIASQSFGSTSFSSTLPLAMASGESENFYENLDDNYGTNVIHINNAQFSEQTCTAVAWG
jgi:hypothetical protein